MFVCYLVRFRCLDWFSVFGVWCVFLLCNKGLFVHVFVSLFLVFPYVVGFRCMYSVLYGLSVCFVVVLWRVFVCFCCLFANVFCSGSNTYDIAVRR